MTGDKGRKKRGSKTTNGLEGRNKAFVLDVGEQQQQQPVERRKEECHMVSEAREGNDFSRGGCPGMRVNSQKVGDCKNQGRILQWQMLATDRKTNRSGQHFPVDAGIC